MKLHTLLRIPHFQRRWHLCVLHSASWYSHWNSIRLKLAWFSVRSTRRSARQDMRVHESPLLRYSDRCIARNLPVFNMTKRWQNIMQSKRWITKQKYIWNERNDKKYLQNHTHFCNDNAPLPIIWANMNTKYKTYSAQYGTNHQQFGIIHGIDLGGELFYRMEISNKF